MKRSRLLIAAVLLCPLSLVAQTTYTYTGVADNNAASQWDVLTNWDLGVIPGSLLNGGGGLVLDDIVVIRNNEGNGTQQRARLTLDAGTIGSLEIGGIGAAGSTGSTQLQLRGAGPRLTVTGDVTLGSTFGGGQRAGQVNFANSNAAMTVNGSVVSGSTSGGNNINVNQGATSTFTLLGDIDSAAARAAIDALADQEIDVIVSRTEGLVLAGGVQELSLESFHVLSTGANVGSITQTIGVDKTVNALNGRVGSVNNNSRIASGTLSVDGGVITYAGNLVVGRAQHQGSGSNDTAEATGNLLVGSGTNPGTVTVGGELILAEQLATTLGNGQFAIGNVIVDNPGSVLTVNGGLNLGATFELGGTTMATFTVNDGQVDLTGPITEDTSLSFTSTMTVAGGELALLDAVGGPRVVDTLIFTGGTIDFTVYGGISPLATNNTELAAAAGGSLIDVTTAPPGTTFSTVDFSTWTGGGTGGAPDGEWDAEVADWDGGVLPSGGFGPIGAGEMFVVITSTNAMTGDPAAAALTPAASGAGWTLTQNANDITLTAASAIAGGVAGALINDGAADVTRTSDLDLEAAAGTTADATQLNIDDVNSLALTGGANLKVGGATAGAVVNQGNLGGGSTGGMAVTVDGSLVLADGSFYNLNEGTLVVGGASLTGAVLDGELIINSPAANSFTSSGPVTVDHLRVGQDTGSNASITIDYALTARLVDIAEDGAAQGAVTIEGGGSLVTSGRVYVAGDQTGNQDESTVGSLTLNTGGVLEVSGGNLEVGRDGMGTFTVDGGIYTQFTNNLVLGQNGTDPDTGAKGILVVESGILTIGDAANGPLNSNLNLNAGGGTVTVNGGDIVIENVLNMTDQGDQDSSVTVNGGTVSIGANLAFRGGSGTDTVTLTGGAVTVAGNVGGNTVSTNQLIMDGPDGFLDVAGNLNLGPTTTLQFNVDPVLGVAPVLVQAIVNLNNGILAVNGLTDTSLGDLLLVEVDGFDPLSVVGDFAGLVDGDAVVDFGDGTGYVLSIRSADAPNDGNDIWIVPGAVTAGDTDGDGMTDAYEIANGLDPNDPADATSDTDADGFAALFEYAMGTAANDASDKPVWQIQYVSDTEVNITYGPVTSGVTYNLNASADGQIFSQIDSFTAGADAPTNTVTDASGSLDVELYQLEVPLPLP